MKKKQTTLTIESTETKTPKTTDHTTRIRERQAASADFSLRELGNCALATIEVPVREQWHNFFKYSKSRYMTRFELADFQNLVRAETPYICYSGVLVIWLYGSKENDV